MNGRFFALKNASVLLLVFSFSFALDVPARFEHVSWEQGLSNTSVFSIVQDTLGFMWFATEDGLNRFDGYRCKVFRHDPTNAGSIAENSVKKLFVSPDGQLWVITRSGRLDRYLAENETFVHVQWAHQASDKPPAVAALTADSAGHVFALTNHGVLFRFDLSTRQFVPFDRLLVPYFKKHGLVPTTVHADRLGCFWVGTWQGLILLFPPKKTFRHFRAVNLSPEAPAGNIIMDIAEDAHGNLWLATNNGVSYWDGEKGRFTHLRRTKHGSNMLPSNRILSLLIDRHARVWFGTLDKGLGIWLPAQKKILEFKYTPANPFSLSTGAVFDLFEDRDGGVWIATYGGGVSYYRPEAARFHHYGYDPENEGALSHTMVTALLKDHRGALWVGTDGGGVNVLFPGEKSFRHYLQRPGTLATNSVTALYETRDGTIWLGTDLGPHSPGGQILKFDYRKKRFTPFTDIRLNFGGTATFLQDHAGRLWIGTFAEGLYCYDLQSGEIKHFQYEESTPNGISGSSIIALCEDTTGSIWIGTLNRGLNCYNPLTNRFRHYFKRPGQTESLGGNTVWCLAQDARGTLWVGTNGGLSRFDRERGTFRTFGVREGLPSNMVYGILPHKIAHLWLGTGQGLVRFNSENFSVRKYDRGDGILNIEFAQRACCRGKDGTFYFGGNRGVTYFKPENIRVRAVEPKIVLTDFSVKGKVFPLTPSITYASGITLNYRQNFFSFAFAALDYAAPNKIQYAYQLQGIDSGWVQCGHRRLAAYTDLAPANYVFRVKATNSDGVWSAHQASVTVTILPPFWQTWWFRTLVLLGFLAVLYAFHSYRLRKLLEVERTRLRIARDLHDDVSATITAIAYFTEALQQQIPVPRTQTVNKLFALIRESVGTVQDSMGDIIWSIKPENDRWEAFFPKLRRFASDLCESKSIAYRIEMPGQLPTRSMNMEIRKNVWLIFKELVTNGVKHSRCRKMDIRFTLANNVLTLSVSDDGNGFDAKKDLTGNGVANVYRRCEMLKAEVHLTTAPGQGTQWKIRFPL